MFQPIEPARIAVDAGGALLSERYGDVYASRDGALGQARHVFLAGNDLPARWRGRDQFVVLETGFGLGINFFATWHAWRGDAGRPRRLHVVSVEKHPVAASALRQWVPPELISLAGQLADAWPFPLPGMHRREFESGAITLTLAFGDAEALVPELVAGVDAFFLDGFAPDRNPAMWSPRVLKALARCARPDATLATWCTARRVRDGLASAGFEISLAEGFGHKRQMLRARFAPRWRVRRHEPAAPYAGERSALVVGAGLAGATAAASLARRGWQVQLIERGAAVAAGASALPWGLMHPQVTVDDNDATRLTRAGAFLALALLHRIAPDGNRNGAPLWRGDGTFVQAVDAEEEARMHACAATLGLPASFARFCTAAEAASLVGVPPQRGGWWFSGGTTVAAARLCDALAADTGIGLRANVAIAGLTRRAGRWIAQGANGEAIAAAPVCIVAAAHDAPRLLRLARAPVHRVRGRLSVLHVGSPIALRAGLSGGGTLMPLDQRTLLAGATYETDEADDPGGADAAWAHASNLQRVARMLAMPLAATAVELFGATRCVARDRLPLVGAVADEAACGALPAPRGAHLADLPRHAGLYASFAFGSRGLVLAPLAAELIAAQIEGEPWPIERSLGARIDVARFLLDAIRKHAP